MPASPRISALALAAALGSLGVASAQTFEKAMSLIPEYAVGMVAIPSLERLNNDLTDLLDRSGRSETVLAGRPIDMMAALVGFSAAFDDRGTFVAWWAGDGKDEMLVFAVPVANSERFLSANLTRDEADAPNAWRWGSGELVYARDLGSHVLLSASSDLVRTYDAGKGLGPTLQEKLGDKGVALLEGADIAIWSGARGLEEIRARGEAGAVEAVDQDEEQDGRFSPEAIIEALARARVIGEGVEQVALGIDADALALSIKTYVRFDSESDLGRATVGGDSSVKGGLLARLPENPYYAAVGIDIKGLGGVERFIDLAMLASIEDLTLPDWVVEMGAKLNGVQFAAYPSKLGLAMGGVLNDSSLVIESEDPSMLEALVEAAIKGANGNDGMIRRTTTWTNNKELKDGLVADEFTLKTALRPKAERPEGARSGDFAMQNMINGLIFGSRGVQGLLKTTDDLMVVTFSRRPDVLERALAAATREGGLGEDPVITAMRGWMLADPDIEVFIDVGRLGALARQLMKLIPGVEETVIPFPEDMPPIGLALSLDGSTLETAAVLPSEVVGAAIGMGMQQALSAP